MPPAAGDIYQFTVQQRYFGQLCESVIHMRSIAPDPTDAALKLSADSLVNVMHLTQVGDVSYPAVLIKRMTPVPFDEIIHIPVGTPVGALATAGHNSTIAVVCTKRTGVSGKSHRGRLYLVGTPSNWGIDRPNVAPGPVTLGTFAGNMLATFGDAGVDATVKAGVYSRSIGGSTPFTVAGWQLITKWDIQPVYGNQRRRREGVGV